MRGGPLPRRCPRGSRGGGPGPAPGGAMSELTPEDESAEVQETNARFYRALEARDLEAMEALWLHADYVRCVHPGWCLLTGWEPVRQSWEAIFKDTRELRFTLSDIVVRISADVAWVTGTENILTQSQGNISVTAVLVTNVFERRGTRWRMVLHHASHILTGEVESSA
ncbi:MAG: DUF4440 domain-containing protein [Candidatus Rokuibacteriota bacterium]|nr:MAG: DUF4440 domain-containing protein [Candidatus Rokubacteria bacterium]